MGTDLCADGYNVVISEGLVASTVIVEPLWIQIEFTSIATTGSSTENLPNPTDAKTTSREPGGPQIPFRPSAAHAPCEGDRRQLHELHRQAAMISVTPPRN